MGSIPDNLYIDDKGTGVREFRVSNMHRYKGTGVREFRVSNMHRYKVTDWKSFNGANGKGGVRIIAENLTLAQANQIAETYGLAHPGSLVNTMEPPYEGSYVMITDPDEIAAYMSGNVRFGGDAPEQPKDSQP